MPGESGPKPSHNDQEPKPLFFRVESIRRATSFVVEAPACPRIMIQPWRRLDHVAPGHEACDSASLKRLGILGELSMIRKEDALMYHRQDRPGKIEVKSTKPCITQRDLAMAYTPGVAEPCREIEKDPEKVFDYTAREISWR